MLLEKTLFILLVLFFAYFLKRFSVFKEEDSGTLINYVIYFALPSAVLQNLRFTEINRDTLVIPLIAWFSIITALFMAFFVGRLLSLDEKSFKAFLLVSTFGNTAFMGYPFVFVFEGKEGLKYAIIYDQLGSFLLVITLGLFIAIGRMSLKELITFPPFIALIFSLLFHGKHFPNFLEYSINVVSLSLIPVILFSLGLRLDFGSISYDIKPVLFSLLIKMVMTPIILLVLLKALDLKGLPYRVALMETAMPPMVFAGVLALKYELNYKLAFSSITLGIILSFLTVPFFLKFLN
ncbi:AEC family transporter [Aquifex pyrophilus]